MEVASPHLEGRDDIFWKERVEEEYANIRAALLSAQEHAPHDFVRMVFALAGFWRMAFHFREGVDWITAAHTAMPDAPGRAAAEALATAAMMAVSLTLWDDCFRLVQESLDRSAADGESPCARAFTVLALAALVQNRPEDIASFNESRWRSCWPRRPVRPGGHSLPGRFALLVDQRRPTRWRARRRGCRDRGGLGNEYALMMTLQAAGTSRYRTDPAGAIVLMEEAFTLRSARGYAASTATTRVMKAVAHLALRDDASAAHALLDSLPVQQQIGEEYYVAMALSLAAVLLRRHGQHTVAARLLALNERLRDDGRILGARRDLESQQHLRERLEREVEPNEFAALWAEGRAMTLDEGIALALDGLAPIAEGG